MPTETERFQEIDLGFHILEIPEGMDPSAAVEAFRGSDAFARLVDRETGTSAFVRAQVGSAPTDDRLANIRRFYPDAMPFDDDNFVFTNPTTGRPTLYNPEGLDIGDVASFGREITQTAFSGMGAAAGAAGGVVAGVPAGPPGMLAAGTAGAIAGAGVGSGVGGALWDMSANLIGGRIDTRAPLERSIDTAIDVVGGSLGQAGGEALEQGLRMGAGALRPATQRLVDSFVRSGIDPPLAAVTGNRAIGSIEQGLANTPASASVIQDAAESVIAQTRQATTNLAERFGTIGTIAETGAVIRGASIRAAERFGFKQETIYTEIFDTIGPTTLVRVDSAVALKAELQTALATAPRSLKQSLNQAISTLDDIISDAGSGGIPFAALRQIRTNIGRDLGQPMVLGRTASQTEAMKGIYAALTDDLSRAATAVSPEVGRRLQVADRFTRQFMNTSGETLRKLANMDADERAFGWVMARTRDGSMMLDRLRRNFTDDEWGSVAGTVLSRLGTPPPSGQIASGRGFSVSSFLTNWSKMTPEARAVLFGGARYRDLGLALDDLVNVVGALKSVDRLANTSGTARALTSHLLVTTLGGATGGLSGGVGGALTGVAGTIVAPNVAARLLTNQTFVRWLVTPVTSANGIAAHVGRLVAIAEAEPAYRDDIQAYVQALRMGLEDE